MTKETMTGPVNGEVGRVYDKFMRVATLTVNGAATNYSFNNDGLLIGAGDITLSRDPQTGFLTGTALAAITDAYTYSTFGETSNYTAKVGGADLFNVQYTRDAIGRITTKSETIGGITTVYEYGYDLAGRLVSVKENGVTVSTYDYDANGNRITAVTKAGTFQGFYDLQDRMTKYGDADYTYTANGELTSKTDSSGVTTYNYDVYGNLRSATMPDGTAIEYVIDGADRRVGKKINCALVQGFIYKDQLEPVAELDGAGNVVSTFVYASKGHVPDYMTKGGVTYRIISDHLGSVRLVINTSDNTITQRIDYDEFGNILSDSNPGFQPFAFAGGICDQHTKLTRFGARDYDALAGRWFSKDLILFSAGSHNVYEYAINDPVNLNDITGYAAGNWDQCTQEEWDECADYCQSKGERLVSCSTYVSKRISGKKIIDYRTEVPSYNCTENGCEDPIPLKDDKYRKPKNDHSSLPAIPPLLPMPAGRNGAGRIGGGGGIGGIGMPIGAGGGACFVGGTMVHTINGLVGIEHIQLGDYVLSYNEITNQVEPKPVISLVVGLRTDLVSINITSDSKPIISSSNHKHNVVGKGWTMAKDISETDLLVDINGNVVPICNISHKLLPAYIKVYNIEVKDNHNYYVGIVGFMTHNKSAFKNPSY